MERFFEQVGRGQVDGRQIGGYMREWVISWVVNLWVGGPIGGCNVWWDHIHTLMDSCEIACESS